MNCHLHLPLTYATFTFTFIFLLKINWRQKRVKFKIIKLERRWWWQSWIIKFEDFVILTKLNLLVIKLWSRVFLSKILGLCFVELGGKKKEGERERLWLELGGTRKIEKTSKIYCIHLWIIGGKDEKKNKWKGIKSSWRWHEMEKIKI